MFSTEKVCFLLTSVVSFVRCRHFYDTLLATDCTLVCSWTTNRYSIPATDATQNLVNPSLSYDSGVLTFVFQRPRNTGDHRDWNFSESFDDCYYFIFPVGGGLHASGHFYRHSRTPSVSSSRLCVSK